jgi:hypothetical protein
MNQRISAEKFNELYPVGTRVNYTQSKRLSNRTGHTSTRTRSEAWMVGGSVAVVLVDGMKAALMLDSLTPGCRDAVKCPNACGAGECKREMGRSAAPGGEYAGKGWGKVPKALKPLAVEAVQSDEDETDDAPQCELPKTHRETRRKATVVKKSTSTKQTAKMEAETC